MAAAFRSGLHDGGVRPAGHVVEHEAAVAAGHRGMGRRRHDDAGPHGGVNVAGDAIGAGGVEAVLVGAADRGRYVEGGFPRVDVVDAHVVQHVLAVAEVHRLPDVREQHRRQELHPELVHPHRLGGRLERGPRQGLEDHDGERSVQRDGRGAGDRQARAGGGRRGAGGRRLHRRRRIGRTVSAGGAGRERGEAGGRRMPAGRAAQGPAGVLSTAHADAPAPIRARAAQGPAAFFPRLMAGVPVPIIRTCGWVSSRPCGRVGHREQPGRDPPRRAGGFLAPSAPRRAVGAACRPAAAREPPVEGR